MNETPELKCCPFCGGAAAIEKKRAYCTACEACGSQEFHERGAALAWNTRATDVELVALRAESAEHLTADQIERLQRELADIRTEFEASDTDTIRRLRAELAARDHRIEQAEAALRSAKDLLSETNTRIGFGYNWNADPDYMTLKQGDVFAAIDAALAGVVAGGGGL